MVRARWLMGILLLGLTAVAGFPATPVGSATDDSFARLVAVACAAGHESPSAPLPRASVLATLDELHALYEGLPGFVDVYYWPHEAVPFRPLFVREVPPEASERVATVPVAFDVLPDEPEPQDPGTLPSTNDIVCPGIRPGSRYLPGCTLNFVYRDAANTYLGTAGHCVGVGALITVPTVGTIGQVVFSTGNAGVGNDFALVRVFPQFVAQVSPEMCNWGGPTGAFAGADILGDVVVLTGHGSVVGLPSIHVPPRPKAGVGISWGATSFMWAGATIPGDSGAPTMLQDGQVMGTHTHRPLLAPGVAAGTRWDRGLQLAAAGGFNVQLVTVGWTHPPPLL